MSGAKIEILLKDNIRTYKAGQQVSGAVVVTYEKPLSLKHLQLEFFGIEHIYVRIDDGDVNDSIYRHDKEFHKLVPPLILSDLQD